MSLKTAHDRQSCDSDSRLAVTLTVAELRELVQAEIGTLLSSQEKPKLLYTTEEAAELCGLPSTWLATAARTGKVKCRRLGIYVRFAIEDLKELIEQAKAVNEECGK